MRKPASQLQPGDMIPAPQHERGWLKSLLTVRTVSDGGADKRGAWLVVSATFTSPYSGKESSGKFKMRPDTLVQIAGTCA